MTIRIRLATSILLATVLVCGNALGGSPKGGWQPEVQRLGDIVERLAAGNASITVQVDPAPCVTDPEQCSGFPPDPAASNNGNPVRLIIQVVTSEAVDDLAEDSFELRTQFSPSGEGRIRPLVCPDCFENREGGTYALWAVPEEGDWEEGVYYLLVTASVEDERLRALTRIEIPLRSNEPARAAVSIFPPAEGQIGVPVHFDGSASEDPDGEITCYQWQIVSDNPGPGPNPAIVQGRMAWSFQKTFDAEQQLTVTLLVSDRTNIECSEVSETSPGGAVEPPYLFSPLTFTTGYTIACNAPPTAVIAGPEVIHVTATPAQPAAVVFDGSLSFDGETALDRYVWSCGSQFTPVPIPGDHARVVCRYFPGTYTATLQVTDQGTGVIDPSTGTFECQRISAPDTVTVNVVMQ
jgi:hypothetical protein